MAGYCFIVLILMIVMIKAVHLLICANMMQFMKVIRQIDCRKIGAEQITKEGTFIARRRFHGGSIRQSRHSRGRAAVTESAILSMALLESSCELEGPPLSGQLIILSYLDISALPRIVTARLFRAPEDQRSSWLPNYRFRCCNLYV
jgi:hypothetical protein